MSAAEHEILKKTPLYQTHVDLGAKMVPFAGWEMPVQYSGVIPEHRCVRTAVGLFDVSHMGEILVHGAGAFELVQFLTCNDIRKLEDGRAQYSALTTASGGIVDDIIVYRYAQDRFFICVNASNADRDFAWIKQHNSFGAKVENLSSNYGQIAVQGPRAMELMKLMPGLAAAADLRSFSFIDLDTQWGKVIVARTGYTGEDGCEVFVAADKTTALWNAFLEIGAPLGAQPIGLGARDTLRLEACLPLHGHELSEQISAIESGLSWIVKPQKGAFLGSDVLSKQLTEGSPRSLVGIFLDEAGITRQDDLVLSASGEKIGSVTSGTRTPTVDRALALALIDSRYAAVDTQVIISVRGRTIKAHVVARPFYKRAKI